MNLNKHVLFSADPRSEMISDLIAAVKAYSVSDAFGSHAPKVTQSVSLHNRILQSCV